MRVSGLRTPAARRTPTRRQLAGVPQPHRADGQSMTPPLAALAMGVAPRSESGVLPMTPLLTALAQYGLCRGRDWVELRARRGAREASPRQARTSNATPSSGATEQR